MCRTVGAAYSRDGRLFVKRVAPVSGAKYPDYGCNFELYTDPSFLELESLAPLKTLTPGQSAEHVEDWMLFEGVKAGSDETWIDQSVLPLVQSLFVEVSETGLTAR